MRGSILALLSLICAAAIVIVMLQVQSEKAGPSPTGGLDEVTESPTEHPSTSHAGELADASGTQIPVNSLGEVPAGKADEESSHATTHVAPLKFPEWPTPKAALVITGEQLGYFEPCGCTANQLGGMSRRASLFDKIRSLGWDVRGIDGGSVSRRTGTQAKMKFETTLEALRELKYVALALGPEELKLEPGYLLSQHLSDGDEPLKFLSANVMFFGSKDLGTPLASTVVDINGVKIGVTSVMSETIRKSVIPDMTPQEAENAEMQWTDPHEELTAVLKSFDEEGVTYRILLAQTTLEESQKLAEDFPNLDAIVRANGFGEGKDQPEMVGKVRMLEVGKKGKTAGVLGLYPDDAENPVRFEMVTLSGELFSDSDRMTQLMQSYQDRLKSETVASLDTPVPHPSGARFVGAAKCGECHTTAHALWKETPHAHSFESLDPANKRKGFERLRGVKRTFDPECIACHVTGWEPEQYFRFETGFINEEFAADDSEKLLQGLLAGNQCENCHGPGDRHVALIEAGDNEAAMKDVKVSLKQVESTCNQCHDGDNSPGFKFEEYWEKVKHYGKD